VTGARKGLIVDGTADDETMRALLDIFDRQESGRTKRGVVRIKRTPLYAQLRGEGAAPPRRLATEQSNTSIAFGDRLITKLFRRVEAGPNPDVEIGEYLTTRTSFRRAPRVGAYLEYEPAGETATHVAAVWELVKSQSDGWHHALAELRRFYDDVRNLPAPAPGLTPARGPLAFASLPAPHAISELTGAYIKSAQQLGRRTAELHLALGSDSSAPAFAPEPFTRDDVSRVVAEAIGGLQALREAIPAAVFERIERTLHVLRDGTDGQPMRLSTARTRIHGDLHLGQVLWSEGDFYVIDFEGEPARPLDERRRKESPMKDVAGMLRSFSYAAYAALFEDAAGRAGEVDRLEPWARAWQAWVGGAFLKGYLAAAGTPPFLPEDPVQRESLLNLFLIDKALYELKYEQNNRPDWVRIPLRGLAELAG
jgi:trehalose synthase-fused probable maltokinase